MAAREVERPEDPAQVGAVAHAVAYAGARMRRIRPCQAARWCVGRAALPQPVREHARVSRFRPPGAHGCDIDAVLAACAVDVFEPMARANPRKCPGFRFEPCRSAAVEIYRRGSVLGLCGVCPELAVAPRSRDTRKQGRGPQLAEGAPASNAPRHPVCRIDCVYLLFGVFLASTIQCARPAGNWPAGALFPASASAPGAVSAWRVLGAAHREKADLCSRAELSARRVVLFSGGLCFQIAAGVLTLAS